MGSLVGNSLTFIVPTWIEDDKKLLTIPPRTTDVATINTSKEGKKRIRNTLEADSARAPTADSTEEDEREVAIAAEKAASSPPAGVVGQLAMPPEALTTSSPKRGRDSDSDPEDQQGRPKKRTLGGGNN